MKFLALGSALEKAGFTQSATKPSEPPPFFSATARKQSVVGGKISRDPIDKLAALLISKAPWWAKPPIIHETPEPADTGTQTPTEKRVRHPSHRFKGKR